MAELIIIVVVVIVVIIIKRWKNTQNFNNLLTRDIVIFCYPNIIDQRCFNIHLQHKLLATGSNFCKNPPVNNVLTAATSGL